LLATASLTSSALLATFLATLTAISLASLAFYLTASITLFFAFSTLVSTTTVFLVASLATPICITKQIDTRHRITLKRFIVIIL
jgi:hypothetical protein